MMVRLKDVKIVMSVGLGEVRHSICKPAGHGQQKNSSGGGDASKAPGWPDSPAAHANDSKSARKKQWLTVTEAGVRNVLDSIVTTPHAAVAASDIMSRLTQRRVRMSVSDQRWNCISLVRTWTILMLLH